MNELPPGFYKFIKIVGLIIFLILSFYISNLIKKYKDRGEQLDECTRTEKQEENDCCERVDLHMYSDMLLGIASLFLLLIIVGYHSFNIYENYIDYKKNKVYWIFIITCLLTFIGYNFFSGFLIHYSPDKAMKIIKLILIDIILIAIIIFGRTFLDGTDNENLYIIYLLFAIVIIYLHFNDIDNCFENIEATKTCRDYDCNKVLDKKWTEETASMWTKCCPLDTECYTDKVDKYIDQDKESYDNKLKSSGGMIPEEAKYRVRKEKCKVDVMRKDIEDGIYA